MNTKAKNIKKYLENNNVNPSYQRIRIMKYLKNHGHPTAEKIYSDIVEEIPTISKTTIYNALHVFIENGIVEEINIKGKKSHYDIAENDHDHFLCLKCSKIFDVKMTDPENADLPEKIQGNKIINSYRYFKGICAECLEKTED